MGSRCGPEEIVPTVTADEGIETELPLRLSGTIALSSSDPDASAFIEQTSRRDGPIGYFIGDEIMPQVSLVQVSPRSVVILNGTYPGGPRRETLTMDDDEDEGGPGSGPDGPAQLASRMPPHAVPAPPPGRPGRPGGPPGRDGERVLNLQEFAKDLNEHYEDLITLRPKEAKDAQGNVVGLTTDNISQHPMAAKLGFQDGDVLQTINGERILNEQQVMEVIQKYSNARAFRIGILRDGRPMTIPYRLE